MAQIYHMEPNFSQKSPMKPQKVFILAQIFVRVLTVATTFAAALVMFTNKQTIQVFGISLDARYSYSPAFEFFVYANAIACGISILPLLYVCTLGRRGSNRNHFFFLFLLDLLVTSLVLAGCAAATAIGGNSHTGSMNICDRIIRFCNKTKTSLMLSYLSLMFSLMLTIISANKSQKILS